MNWPRYRREIIARLWPMRSSPYIRPLLHSTLRDCRALEQ
jgi:hypothetical protein